MEGYFFNYDLKENIKYEDALHYYNMIKSFFDIDYYTWLGISHYYIDDRGYHKTKSQHSYKKNTDMRIANLKDSFYDYNTLGFEKVASDLFLHIYCSYKMNSLSILYEKTGGVSDDEKERIDEFFLKMFEPKQICKHSVEEIIKLKY